MKFYFNKFNYYASVKYIYIYIHIICKCLCVQLYVCEYVCCVYVCVFMKHHRTMSQNLIFKYFCAVINQQNDSITYSQRSVCNNVERELFPGNAKLLGGKKSYKGVLPNRAAQSVSVHFPSRPSISEKSIFSQFSSYS